MLELLNSDIDGGSVEACSRTIDCNVQADTEVRLRYTVYAGDLEVRLRERCQVGTAVGSISFDTVYSERGNVP